MLHDQVLLLVDQKVLLHAFALVQLVLLLQVDELVSISERLSVAVAHFTSCVDTAANSAQWPLQQVLCSWCVDSLSCTVRYPIRRDHMHAHELGGKYSSTRPSSNMGCGLGSRQRGDIVCQMLPKRLGNTSS